MSAATNPMETISNPFRALADAVENAQPQQEAVRSEQARQGDITDAIIPRFRNPSKRPASRPRSSSN